MKARPLTPVVLAAGRSTRMGARNKLLVPVAGVPVIRRVVLAMHAGAEQAPLVVLGHDAERVRAALDGLDVRYVENPLHQTGMGTSVAVAARAITEGGVLLTVGDVPLLQAASVRAVVERFTRADRPRVVQPTFEGRPGHPVAFASSLVPALRNLDADVGARELIRAAGPQVVRLALDDPGIVRDVDSEAELADLVDPEPGR